MSLLCPEPQPLPRRSGDWKRSLLGQKKAEKMQWIDGPYCLKTYNRMFAIRIRTLGLLTFLKSLFTISEISDENNKE